MSSMMGGQPGSQEDMFARLDSMRSIISEVNKQFKDPVSRFVNINGDLITLTIEIVLAGKDDICLRVHLGVLVTL